MLYLSRCEIGTRMTPCIVNIHACANSSIYKCTIDFIDATCLSDEQSLIPQMFYKAAVSGSAAKAAADSCICPTCSEEALRADYTGIWKVKRAYFSCWWVFPCALTLCQPISISFRPASKKLLRTFTMAYVHPRVSSMSSTSASVKSIPPLAVISVHLCSYSVIEKAFGHAADPSKGPRGAQGAPWAPLGPLGGPRRALGPLGGSPWGPRGPLGAPVGPLGLWGPKSIAMGRGKNGNPPRK